MEGKFSREYIFQECVLFNHCLGAELSNPVTLDDGRICWEIPIVDIILNRQELDMLQKNMVQGIETSGMMRIKTFYSRDGVDRVDTEMVIDTNNIIGLDEL